MTKIKAGDTVQMTRKGRAVFPRVRYTERVVVRVTHSGDIVLLTPGAKSPLQWNPIWWRKVKGAGRVGANTSRSEDLTVSGSANPDSTASRPPQEP